ncbi:MAG: class I SAM-dependent methyltransferase [Methanobacteriota archaeon]
MRPLEGVVAENIRAYDETVGEYYEKTKGLEPSQIEKREDFIAMLKKGVKIVDIGCGSGRDAKFFSERGLDVLGIDLSEKTVEFARKVAPKARFKVMDFLDMQILGESFDGVWFGASIFCVQKKHTGKALREVNRILKEGGVMYVSFKEGVGEGFELDERYNKRKYFAYYKEQEIKPLILNSGFEILKTMKPKYKSKYHTHPYIQFFCRKRAF